MLPKKMRLSRNDFTFIASKRPRRAQTGVFSLSFYPENDLKVACIVPNKVAKKAVMRHLIKRFIYNAFMKEELPKPGWYVFIMRQPIEKVTFKLVKDAVNEMIKGI